MSYYSKMSNKSQIKNRKKIVKNAYIFFRRIYTDARTYKRGDPIIKILLVALLIKVIFLFKDFDYFETLGILIAIFLASFISTISEYGSEAAFERLQEESAKIKVKVKRNNKILEIPIEEVVVNE